MQMLTLTSADGVVRAVTAPRVVRAGLVAVVSQSRHKLGHLER